MKVYIISISDYGDMIRDKLVRALKKKNSNIGIYGDFLIKNKMFKSNTVYRTQNLSKLIEKSDYIIKNILDVDPDIVITIGNWDFFLEIHKIIKKMGKIMQAHYMSPDVLDHNKNEAIEMSKYIHHLLTILPNEEQYFIDRLPVTFVGNPAVENHVIKTDIKHLRDTFGLTPLNKIVTIFPGSIIEDIKKMLPLFLLSAESLGKENSLIYFGVLANESNVKVVKEIFANYKINGDVITNEEYRADLISVSSAVIDGSKLDSLDLSVAGIPHIMAYRYTFLEKFMNPRKFKLMNLSNIVFGRDVIPFLRGLNCTKSNIIKYVLDLVNKEALYKEQEKAFHEIYDLLYDMRSLPSEKAATIILDMVEKESCVLGVDCIYRYE